MYQPVRADTIKAIANMVCDKYFTGNKTESPLKISATSNNAFQNPSVIDCTFSGTNLANIERNKR